MLEKKICNPRTYAAIAALLNNRLHRSGDWRAYWYWIIDHRHSVILAVRREKLEI